MDDAAEHVLARARLALAVAGGALVLGAFLPWAEVSAPDGGSFSLNGLDRGSAGVLVVAAGVLVLGIAAVGTTRGTAVLAGIVGASVLVVAIPEWADLRRVVEHAEDTLAAPVDGSVALGLWLIVLASLAVVATAAWVLSSARSWRAPARPRRR
jgi:hypothetical protein